MTSEFEINMFLISIYNIISRLDNNYIFWKRVVKFYGERDGESEEY